MRKGALISECKKYRYCLWRLWDDALPQVDFIMLNPSTADGEQDDPTIRRCINFAKRWGAGSIRVLNLFAYRTTSPSNLKIVDDPIGPANDFWLQDCPGFHERLEGPLHIICGWGNHGSLMNRSEEVLNILKKREWRTTIECLQVNSSGQPSHPLYLSSKLNPTKYLNG